MTDDWIAAGTGAGALQRYGRPVEIIDRGLAAALALSIDLEAEPGATDLEVGRPPRQ
ncbi:MAG TPA: hypothetical protein VHG53_06470 [Candidatus Limnocylindria bacterium]|nr:hypothetical protein [Candidatus Limnocylindria bacterium]